MQVNHSAQTNSIKILFKAIQINPDLSLDSIQGGNKETFSSQVSDGGPAALFCHLLPDSCSFTCFDSEMLHHSRGSPDVSGVWGGGCFLKACSVPEVNKRRSRKSRHFTSLLKVISNAVILQVRSKSINRQHAVLKNSVKYIPLTVLLLTGCLVCVYVCMYVYVCVLVQCKSTHGHCYSIIITLHNIKFTVTFLAACWCQIQKFQSESSY